MTDDKKINTSLPSVGWIDLYEKESYESFLLWSKHYYATLQTILNIVDDKLLKIEKNIIILDRWIIYKYEQQKYCIEKKILFEFDIPYLKYNIDEPYIKNAHFVHETKIFDIYNKSKNYVKNEQKDQLFRMLGLCKNPYKFLNRYQKQLDDLLNKILNL